MTHAYKRLAATVLLTIATGPFFIANTFAATTDDALAATVHQVLTTQLGKDVKDVTVAASNGTITLSGWTQGSAAESKARYIASTVPGVARAYSKIRMFSTSDYR
jgi:osmotically-inducible protein OsmY